MFFVCCLLSLCLDPFVLQLHDVNEDELYRVAHDVGQETHQEHHVFQHQHHDKEASVIGPMLVSNTV